MKFQESVLLFLVIEYNPEKVVNNKSRIRAIFYNKKRKNVSLLLALRKLRI